MSFEIQCCAKAIIVVQISHVFDVRLMLVELGDCSNRPL